MLLLAFALLLTDAPKPKLPIGKDTTVVEGPIDADGYIDFEAALNDRLSKGVTPETNACVPLWQAIGPTPQGKPMHPDFFKRLGMSEPPTDGPYFVRIEPFVKDRGRVIDDDFFALDRRLMSAAWTAQQQPDHAAWLAKNKAPLARVIEASRRPAYYSPIIARATDGKPGLLIGALLPGVQKCREFGQALAQRAMLRAGAGKFDEAWADLLALRRLARHVARGGTLIELLVGYALDGIAFSATQGYIAARKPTAEQAAACLRDLAALPPMPGPAEKIDLAERFVFLDVVQFTRRGGTDTVEKLAGGKGGRVPKDQDEKLMAALNWGVILQQGNHWYDRGLASLRQPTRAARKAAWEKVEADLKALKAETVDKAGEIQAAIEGGGDPSEAVRMAVTEAISGILVGMMMPAAGKLQLSADRVEQQARLTRLAFALAAHRADTGAYPETLAALVPKYLPAIEPDLFSDQPLIYKPAAGGYLLYSVGPNETDDGGRGPDDHPKGDDPRVRVP